MRPDYPTWLSDQKYSSGTQTTQISRIARIEEHYGDLEELYKKGKYDAVIETLKYSASDKRQNRLNPSKLKINGDLQTSLQSYRDAVSRYRDFLKDNPTIENKNEQNEVSNTDLTQELLVQKLSLERDMQAALRQNISSLSPNLRIIDDGIERAVGSGKIDITCEDENGLVVIELKAGVADSRAIGQILGYMGDLVSDEIRDVRGILIAHDFDKRTLAAAKVLPNVSLIRYNIQFFFNRV